MLAIATWCLTALLMIVGLIGTVVPMVPGTTLIFAAAVIHKLILPEQLSWLAVSIVGFFWIVSLVADFGCVMLGTKWFGGSRWGMAGASGGALVGMFFSLPALILGTILGAMAAEKLLAKKADKAALKAGLGAATGFILSTIARLFCAGVMITLFLIAALYTPAS